MNGSDSLAQVEGLSRSCVLLRRSGAGDPAAAWRGPGVLPPPPGPTRYPWRHWISVDCRSMPAGLGLSDGVLSVYLGGNSGGRGYAVHDPAATLPADVADPLYAHPARSLPPPEALPDEGGEGYRQRWQDQCPLYTGSAVAMLGGWSMPWMDGDWDELCHRPLLAWTFEDSEPWVEVWGGLGGFTVIGRIT